jgi:UDP-N-acetylmuramoyl-tripeptide--D-alanyl-D-alanine ligase
MGKCSKISFSAESAKGDYYLENYSQDGIQINVENQTISLGKLNVPGKHNIHNLLAAIVVARYFNLSWDEIRQGISHLKLPEKRLQFVHQQGILFLNDSYNASELSVKAALETLSETNQKGEKIAVLGSMMELGHFSDESHRKVGVFALEHVDKMYCLGVECLPIVEVWKKAGKPVEFFTSRQELVLSLSKKLKPSDIVLLKGSRSKELWKVLEELV